MVRLVRHEHGYRYSHFLHTITVGLETPAPDEAKDPGNGHFLLGVLVSGSSSPFSTNRHKPTQPFLALNILTPRSPPSVCIISVYRLSTLYSGVVSPDPSWDNIGAAIWSAVELGVSILASNLPTLRPLLARLLPGIGLTSDQRYRSSYMRYGRSAQPGGPQKSNPTRKSLTGERGGRSESVGTEELALREMDPERGGSVTGNYAIASSNRETSFAAMDHENSGQIIMTTDITVNSGRR